ncbi:MAG: glutamate synthase-related protein [Methanobacterium sp. ERen5]|nr:MAG: glutamate synthase-related protein [Methanobacterium sp. ERen5]
MVQDSESKLMKIKNSPENRAKCHCKLCPSYPYKCGGEVLYCGKGPSKCDVDIEVCICDTCPIYFEHDLKGIYFCDKDMVGENKIFMRKKHSDEDDDHYQTIVDIKDESAVGESVIGSMGSLKKLPFSLDDLYFVPAQVMKLPLNTTDPVKTSIVLGKDAKKPLELSNPIMISGLSFGAVSKSAKSVISKTASNLNVGFNSGEGGVLDEELARSKTMVVQYSTGRFGVEDEILKNAAAIEIRFGQGAYPGKGSYLPAEKMTEEVSSKRNLENGEPAYSPAHHPDILTPRDLKRRC